MHLKNTILKRIQLLFPRTIDLLRTGTRSNRWQLLLGGKYKLYVWIAPRYLTSKLKLTRWKLRPHEQESDGLTLVCMLNDTNEECEWLFLFPALKLENRHYFFGLDDKLLSLGVRLTKLSELCEAARQVLIANALPLPQILVPELRPRNRRR